MKTIKGKGLSKREDLLGYHGKPLAVNELDEAQEIKDRLSAKNFKISY